MIGRTLSHYQVLENIGEGGMGVVYRALDTRLDRPVALKVLPADQVTDAERKRRFVQEAKAASALNHPNIITIYDIDQDGGVDFIAMEHVAGRSLEDRISRHGLRLPEVLRYGVQIADALAAAHASGIIHRDLKPGNIMVADSGLVKVLDFGIAKLTENRDVRAERPTQSAATLETGEGSILGTIAYMSPEQAQGLKIDTRSDIFSLGAVIYEMLTGRRAFSGETTVSTLSAILTREPQPLDPTIPRELDRIVARCLRKDPARRFQTMADLKVALEELKEESDSGRLAPPARPAGTSSRWALATALAVMAALASVGAWWLWRSMSTAVHQDQNLRQLTYDAGGSRTPVPDLPSARFEIATPPTSDPMSFAVSSDGRTLAFVATTGGASKLWVRPLAQITAQVLDGTDGASYPFWSPDGGAIAFFADGKLRRIDLGGGRPEVVADAPTGRGGSWSRHGVILFAPTTASTLMRIPAAGGAPVPATHLAEGENSHRWPQFLPDGRHFLFLSTQGQPGTEGVFMGALDRGPVTRILDDDSPAAYAPPGRLVVARQGALVSIPFDPDRPGVSAETTVVARPVGFDTQLVRAAFAVSDTGVLAHRSAIAARRQLEWVDRAGARRGTVGPPDEDGMAAPDLTRDGRRVAIFRSVEGNADIWTVPVEGGVPSRFTFDAGVDAFPLWSPDGRRIMLTTIRRGNYGLLDRSTLGEEQWPFQQSELKIAMDYSADGRFFLYAVQGPRTGVDLWAVSLPIGGDRAAFPFAQMPFDEMAGQFSPNGEWVAYQANASGRLDIYVRPFPGPGTQQQVSPDGGSQPRWSPDGKELFYVAADGRMMAIPVRIDAARRTLETSMPRPLFQTRLATGANIPPAVGSRPQYAVGPGGRFLMNVVAEGAPAPPITIVLNWPSTASK